MKNDKFAVIKLGGAQHLVREGDVFEVNKLDEEAGKSFDVSEVLLIQSGEDVQIGTPFLEKTKVTLKVVEQTKGDKVTTRTFKAKTRYRRTVGQRPKLTKVEVTKIS